MLLLIPWKREGDGRFPNSRPRRTPCLRCARAVNYSRIGVLIFGTIGDRNALWFFIVAVCAALAGAVQNYALMKAAADLTAKLRAMIFQATLRQDSK